MSEPVYTYVDLPLQPLQAALLARRYFEAAARWDNAARVHPPKATPRRRLTSRHALAALGVAAVLAVFMYLAHRGE
jgi:hypothetical protein